MARTMKAGATSQSIYFVILDSTSTTGGRKTGLAYNTSSLTAYYALVGGSATQITLATLAAANSAWSSGGFKEVDATNMPGIYRLDVPDAAIASGPGVVITLKGATGMVQVDIEIQLEAVNAQDAVRGGMTALPNANAEASGGLPTLSAAQASNGTINANVHRWLTGTPNALVSNRVDTTVGAMQNGVVTAAAVATDAIDADALAADAVTEIQSGLATAAALSTVAGYIDTEVAAILAAVDTEVAAIKAKTDNLPTDPADASDIAASFSTVNSTLSTIAGYIDTEVAAIKAKTDNLPSDPADQSAVEAAITAAIGSGGAALTAIPWNAAWDAEVQSEVADALEATIADSIPADGTAPSVKQALYMLTQFMLERAVSSTTVTVKKPDGSTTLFTLSLDSGTAPTSITRAT